MADVRDYVLNDFSIVEKAKFIIEATDKKESDTLNVQINPNDIEFNYGLKVKEIAKSMAAGDMQAQTKGSGESTIDIPLKFDIYDEYMAASMNDSIYTDLSLVCTDFDDKGKGGVSALDRLAYWSRRGANHVAAFYWGAVVYKGTLERVSGHYTCFSRWGHVLKADVMVTMRLGNANSESLLQRIKNAADKAASFGVMNAMLIADAALR